MSLQPRTLLLIPVDEGVALTSAALGMLRALDTLGLEAGFLQPFSQAEGIDDDSNSAERARSLVASTLGIGSPRPVPREDVEHYLGRNDSDGLLELAVERHSRVAKPATGKRPAFIVVEGIRPLRKNAYALDLNVRLASALDAQVILVADGQTSDLKELAKSLAFHRQSIDAVGSRRTLGTILMRLPSDGDDSASDQTLASVSDREASAHRQHWQDQLATASEQSLPVVAAVPYRAALTAPRTLDVARALGARILHHGDADRRRVAHTTLGARSAEHLLYALRPGELIVSPGDRDDTLLAAALATMNGVPLAGLLLTHGETPSKQLIDVCQPALSSGLPVLSVDTDSFTTVAKLTDIPGGIPVDDQERAEAISAFVADHLDREWLLALMDDETQRRLSPAAFRHQLVSMAQQKRQRIVLPEGDEPRTLEAAILCQRRGIANCVLLGKRQAILEVAKARGLELPDDLQILDPDSERCRFIAPMVERRKGKLTPLTAEAQLHDSVVLGTMMLAEGEVDGLVSGAIHTTANTVRPAFQLIKTAPGYAQVSSVFFMLLPDQVVVYGDCAVNPDPDADALAEIALQSAASAEAFGIEPRVAMISYSTGESGTGADVDKVREATRIARQKAPHLPIDGPLQYDAAAIASVARQKAPDSPVAGRATVFVFPDLNTGNTTYKAVQRSARVVSIGPMLQGLNKPVNDLSRGALVEDIVYTIALTAIQAGQ
ncbi:phosphate acetyltransferase [Halomonas litopenaei]|uniref:phosphate acetyltransferase n=1 Tax=Halomonas litopenaei TaxID=2109328 RepID=UPI001A8D7896|nr:phosphate acetyltransferase [Halomonas litopenaei]MBN8413201.1 phosphate acetyltransferase [Halomonas litopenaei]